MKKIELAAPASTKSKSLYHERKKEMVRQRNDRVLTDAKKRFLQAAGVMK